MSAGGIRVDGRGPEPPAGWVPVDERRAGVDRRTMTYAIVVAAIGILLGGVLPLVDDAIPYDDELVAGDLLDLGSGVTLDPPDGWLLVRGFRVGDETVAPRSLAGQMVVSSGAVRVVMTADSFSGTPEELLDQVNTIRAADDEDAFTITGAPRSITTAGGITGVVERYGGIATEGVIGAFVIPATDDVATETGVTFTASGPDGELAPVLDDIEQMLTSLTTGATS